MNVIFDMDGVISDSEAVYLAGYLHAAKLYDLPVEEMRVAVDRATGVTDELERQIMVETFGHLPQFNLEKTFKACRDYFHHIVETGQMELRPGAAKVLRDLKERGVPVGLASSSPRERIDKVLERHEVLRFFDVIVSGDMVERGKPDPEIFLTCAEKMGIAPAAFGATYVIEDSYNGIRAACAAGMQPIMVPDQLAPNEEMRQRAVAILPSLDELIPWLVERGL